MRFKRPNLRPERPDFRPERPDYRTDRADFRPEMTWGNERTNERTDGRTNENPPAQKAKLDDGKSGKSLIFDP